MAKLTGGDYFHIYSLMETTLSFFAGYDTRVFPQSEKGGEKSNYYNRALLQHKHNLEAELFMLAVYVKAINLQPHNHHTVFEVYIYRAGNTPRILLNIFLNMVSIDSLV